MHKPVLIGLIVGAALVAGGLLFGPSALTASGLEPDMCAACHVMEQNVHSFRETESLHRTTTSCSDCHLPYGGVEGWKEKYKTGFRHIRAQVTGQIPEDLRLTPEARAIVIANCARCHGQEEHATLNGINSCLNCHSNDPHGERGL